MKRRKQRGFIARHVKDLTAYNYGKTGRKNKQNRRLAQKIIRNRLRKEMEGEK